MHVGDIQHKGKEGGQTNESLNPRAAHAADAARDAALWTGRKQAAAGRGGQGERGGRGARRGALCGGPGRAAPRPTPPPLPAHSPSPAGWSRSGSVRTPGPRESTLFGLRKQSIQTSIRGLVYGEAGRGGAAASTWPPARPAPRRRTCDRCAAAPVAGRAGRPRHPRPRPPGAPGPSAGRGAPRAPARTHIAPQLLLGGRFPQPAGAHHVAAAAAAHAAGRPEPAAGSGTRARAAGSAGRRCAARGEGEGPGRPAAAGRGRGRGRGGAARLPRARPRLLPARPRRGRPGRKGGARSPRPQPAAPPGGPPAETRTPPRASDPALSGAPAARRAPRGLFSEASGAGGRALGGRGVMGMDCAPSMVNRPFAEGRQPGARGLLP